MAVESLASTMPVVADLVLVLAEDRSIHWRGAGLGEDDVQRVMREVGCGPQV
ncbi:MAG: hypothetical protein U0228_08050 [Myxococcaceae bacterium]